jgi:hypothetical protein
LGGVAVVLVSGLGLVASLAGPYVLGGLALWLTWRSFKRWKIGYEAAGGASNPQNPFRRGPWTREARAASQAIKQHQRLNAFFMNLSPQMRHFMAGSMGGQPFGAGFGPGGGASSASAASAGGGGVATDTAFLTHKVRATLLQQALRHPALRGVASGSVVPPRARSVRTVIRPSRSSGGPLGAVELHVEEVSEIFSGPGAEPRGVLNAQYVLRLMPEQARSLQDEMAQWKAARAAQVAEDSDFANAARAGGGGTTRSASSSSVPEPSPFDGALFTCVRFEQASWRARQGSGVVVDLTADPQFRDGRAPSGHTIIQEAEFEERPPPKS